MTDDRSVPDGGDSFDPELSDTEPLEAEETTPAPPPPASEPRLSARTEVPFGLILFLVVAVLLVVFTVQNSSEEVTLKFFAWEGKYPLALIIIGVVTVTVILDEVLGLFLRRRRRRRLAEKQELRRLREMNR